MALKMIRDWQIAKAKKRREEAVKRDPLNVLLYEPLLDGELERIQPPRSRRRMKEKFYQFCSFCDKERELGRTDHHASGTDSRVWYCSGCGNGIKANGLVFSRSISDYGTPVRRTRA